MRHTDYWIAGASFVVSLVMTGFVRKAALTHKLLDTPNSRSSHQVPTPRGGGLAIVVAVLLAAAAAWLSGAADTDLVVALVGGGLAVAAVGLADDRRPVSSALRFAVHMAAATWAICWLGGLPPLRFGADLDHFGLLGYVLGILGLVWSVNLFNFMDGIDGIAATEAIFMTVAGFFLLSGGPSAPLLSGGSLMLAMAGANAGFLCWNWPPARIFMGDVGSGFVGFAIGVLAIASSRQDPVGVPIYAVLGAAFIADTGVTLVTRLLRRETFYKAHRTHAYQVLTGRWGSHRSATVLICLFNVTFLLPSAICVSVWPERAGKIMLVALLIPAIIAIGLGAGRKPS